MNYDTLRSLWRNSSPLLCHLDREKKTRSKRRPEVITEVDRAVQRLFKEGVREHTDGNNEPAEPGHPDWELSDDEL